jgi:hypothetical protein
MAIKHIIVLFVETPRKFITAKLSGSVSPDLMKIRALQLISYNFSVNVANFVPNFVVKFKSS